MACALPCFLDQAAKETGRGRAKRPNQYWLRRLQRVGEIVSWAWRGTTTPYQV